MSHSRWSIPAVTPEALAAFAAPASAELARLLNIRSAMAVPLQFRGKRTGAMSFMSDHRTYGQDDLRFAEAYARQVSGILENTRLYQQAQEALCVRDEFVALASHELRTPLTALRTSAAGILRQAEKGDGAASESVLRLGRIVARQVEHLDRLNERILAASQIVGHLTLRTERFDLAASVGEVARSLAVRAGQSGSGIRVEAEAPVIGVWDRGRIEQAVGNLLENAIKFGAGQRIEVSVGARDGTAIVSVRDHGIGISAEHLGTLFQRYQRGVSAQNFGGLGLGLYIVRVIVEAHGGVRHRIEAVASGRDGSAIVSVRDHGIGISADQVGTLFQRYQRGVPARRTSAVSDSASTSCASSSRPTAAPCAPRAGPERERRSSCSCRAPRWRRPSPLRRQRSPTRADDALMQQIEVDRTSAAACHRLSSAQTPRQNQPASPVPR